MGEKLKGAILSDEGVHRGSVVYLLEITSGNPQLMWGSENLKKSDNLPDFFIDKWNALCKLTGNELKMR
jgi:hypothetical protein